MENIVAENLEVAEKRWEYREQRKEWSKKNILEKKLLGNLTKDKKEVTEKNCSSNWRQRFLELNV